MEIIDPRKSPSGIQLSKDLLASKSIDLEDILHQTAIETMAACLCRVGEAMPTKERMLKLSRADLSFCYTPDGLLQEAKVMIIPLKKSVRDRKFDAPEGSDRYSLLCRPLSEMCRTPLADVGADPLQGRPTNFHSLVLASEEFTCGQFESMHPQVDSGPSGGETPE